MPSPRRKPRALPKTANVLLLGTGGREHALAWKLRQSPRLGELWVEQGANAGLQSLGRVCPEEAGAVLGENTRFRLKRFCVKEKIDLVVIGPEAHLAAGHADLLSTDQTVVFGPNAQAAQLEADKAFAKQLMRSAAVPCAEGRIFHDLESAEHYLEPRDEPCVVKAAGLAAGKGVIVCDTRDEALEAVRSMMSEKTFGDAGETVIIEERLQGQEISVLALVDGRSIWVLDPAQDHKQVGEGDVGPNTGGMGAYCPTPLATREIMSLVERDVLVPTVDALRREGIEFRGVLYAGMMLTPAGPKVLEFNVRFGDPECQPIMARLESDLLALLWHTATGMLDSSELSMSPKTACTVVLCSAGYPGAYSKGHVISGIEQAEAMDGVTVFHAGTARNSAGDFVTAGGRVLSVTALGTDLCEARDRANAACELISFDGKFFRSDIGSRVLGMSTG